MYRHTSNRLMVTLGITIATATIIISCNNGIDESKIDASHICSISNAAFSSNKFDILLPIIENQFKVNRNKIRITEKGIFIPLKESFVEEQGFFIQRPNIKIIENGSDPGYEHFKSCIYRYRIKG